MHGSGFFAAWQHRALRIVTIIYAIMIFIGSIVLGWHYAVDGIAGFVLALLAWAAARPIARASLRGAEGPAGVFASDQLQKPAVRRAKRSVLNRCLTPLRQACLSDGGIIMKRLIFISELSVVAGLLLLTAFFGVRLWIGLDPSSPLAWRAFLEMPDVIREPANLFYYGTGLPVAYCAAFFALATGVGIALMRATNHLRLRLVFFSTPRYWPSA
ncbi:phosphatase PAP2 family protein [Roseibium salinum]|nr:phosphatase PAP2 family protein [Roseibium salinum]